MTGSDTIVAISSAEGPGLRAIVRLSGPRAAAIVAEVFSPAGPAGQDRRRDHYRAADGTIRVAEFSVPAACYYMPAPRSYTREDVVEIHTVSSGPLLTQLLAALTRLGARPAEPGEFTRRAFLNGRLDLTQAESVLGIIEAASNAELAAALRALRGSLGSRLRTIHRELVALLAQVELALDFSDQEIELSSTEELVRRIADARNRIGLLQRTGSGVATHAPTVALVGRPNVGKSSLLNRLVGQERVLVDETPGTTRDVVEAPFLDSTIVLADTPGVEQPRSGAPLPGADAEIVVYVLDRSQGIVEDDWALRSMLQPAIVAVNKADLPSCVSPIELARFAQGAEIATTSALSGEGVDNLVKLLANLVETRLWKTCGYLWVNARAAALLAAAATALDRAREAFEEGQSWEFPAAFIREALDPVASLLGERTDENTLDLIFSRFCIGK